MKNGWTKEWPNENGYYWFYGYRYGKISCGVKSKPKMILMKNTINNSGDSFLVGNGGFIYKSEVDSAWFKKAELPKPPENF